MQANRVERLTDIAIAAFLWAFRIAVVLIVVVGSMLTLLSGRYSLDTWISLVVSGLTLGSIYALIALGYTMVYGILRMINFAHGEIFMTGGFAGHLPRRDAADLRTADPLRRHSCRHLRDRDHDRAVSVRAADQAGHCHPGGVGGQGNSGPDGHRREPGDRDDVRPGRSDGRCG